MVTENEDGSYTILINARLSDEGRLMAYEHALKHIREDDFQKENVQDIESSAHSLPVIPAASPAKKLSVSPVPSAKTKRRRRRRAWDKWDQYDKDRREFFRRFNIADTRPGLLTEQVENHMVLNRDF